MRNVIRVYVTLPASHPRNQAQVALHEHYTFAQREAATTFMDEITGAGPNGGCIVSRYEDIQLRESAEEALLHLWSRARR